MKICFHLQSAGKNYITKTQSSSGTLVLAIKKQGLIYPLPIKSRDYQLQTLVFNETREWKREITESWHILHFLYHYLLTQSNFTKKGKVFHESFSYWKSRKLSPWTCSWLKYRQLSEDNSRKSHFRNPADKVNTESQVKKWMRGSWEPKFYLLNWFLNSVYFQCHQHLMGFSVEIIMF